METQFKNTEITSSGYVLEAPATNGIDYMLKSFSRDDIITAFEKIGNLKNFFQLLNRLATPASKKSFLVFKRNKYFTVPVENIAFFYIKNESSVIMCFDRNEYSLNYSLDEIQNLISVKQFYRLNRQYLINFHAVQEVEHYFARKLFVKPAVPVQDKLLVSKEKAGNFLQWLDNR